MNTKEDNNLPELRPFNFDNMYKYLGDDKAKIKEILLKVLDELRVAIKKFDDYFLNKSLAEMQLTAHQLVNTTASVGLERLCTTVKKIEQQKNFDPSALKQLLLKLKHETRLVKSLINSYLVNH
ncbi:MAG TPA: hypothetical protein VF273_08315 [Pelobium sp.]